MSMEELKNQIETDIIASSKEKYNSVYILLTGAAGLALICILCAFVRYRRRRTTTIAHEEAQTDDKASTSGTPATDAESLRLALAKGNEQFGQTSVCHDINAMKVNERELPAINSEGRRNIERTLLESFAEACGILLEDSDLNEQELVCILCMYLGYSNTLAAHLGHTTNATIRKRKERIRKKVSAARYEVVTGEKQ